MFLKCHYGGVIYCFTRQMPFGAFPSANYNPITLHIVRLLFFIKLVWGVGNKKKMLFTLAVLMFSIAFLKDGRGWGHGDEWNLFSTCKYVSLTHFLHACCSFGLCFPMQAN